MSQQPEPAIRLCVEPTNPGQFFACCGLLELADRLWSGAEGWFDGQGTHFFLRPAQAFPDPSAAIFIDEIARCRLSNAMTDAQRQRLEALSAIRKSERAAGPSLEAEKKLLDALRREAPILLHDPFNLRLDWFLDKRAEGDTFKTWAGQQSVVEIAGGMKALIRADHWEKTPTEEWLYQSTNSDCVPFNFDSDLGGMGSDRDIGFSVDPLKSTGLRLRTRPLLEFAAFVGLQRFRPTRVAEENRFRFSIWADPLVPQVAAVAACGLLQPPHPRAFEFRLHYRTKYLKSFLPAKPIGESL